MASVIRVNTINSRSGLSTVTFDNSGAGVEVAGIVTATTFSGNLTGTLNTAAQGNITSLGTLSGLTIDNNANTSMSSGSAGQLQVGGDGYTGAIALDADAMHIYHNSSIRDIVFGINESEKVRIDTAGKVGIGSTVPKLGLDINRGANSGVFLGNPTHGYQLRANVSSSNDYGLMIEDEDGVDLYRATSSTGTSNANTHTWWTAGEERLRIKSDGNIVATGNLKTNNLSGRNIIINGAFKINQRGSTSTADGIHTVDRFSMEYGGENEVPTQTQHALTSSDTGPWEKGLRYSYHILNGNQTGGAGTTDYMRIATRLEAQDLANSGWHYTSSSSYATLSFWVKSSVAQTFYGQVFSQDGTPQNFPFSTGALSANTWTKVEIKIPGGTNVQFDNNNKQGMVIYWWPFGGTNYTGSPTLNTWAGFSSGNRIPDMTSTWWTTNDATFELTGIQLEAGSQATEFDHLPYGEDLRRCYRYFYKITGDSGDRPGIGGCCVNTTEARMNVTFPVTMRSIPVIGGSGTAQFDAENDSADFNCDDMTIESAPTGLINSLGLQIVTSSMTGGQGGNLRFRSDSSYLTFNAEL